MNSSIKILDKTMAAFDYVQVDCLRHVCTEISVNVRNSTGYWVQPSSWQVLFGLCAVLAALTVWRKFAPTQTL